MSQSKWQEIKNFVNTNEHFTRKDMKDNFKKFSQSHEQYILILKHIGFIDKPTIATYDRIVKIPEKLTSSYIIKLMQNEELKNAYMSKIIRKEKLNKVKNSSLE